MDEIIVGIDLGTTNSLVSYCSSAGPEIITGANGERLVPSVVCIEGDHVTVGREAREHAVERPEATVYSIKRLMGRSYADLTRELGTLPYAIVPGPRQTVRVRINGREYSPEELSAIILGELKKRAEEHFGREIGRAVITVPAYFDDSQRQATRVAGELAGLEVVRIINEPTAAAIAYGLDRKDSSTVAVYDLGGGTFDISILKLSSGVFQVLSTHGETHLGGDDFDRELIELIMGEIRHRFGSKIEFPPNTRQALRNLAEQCKIRLSTDSEVTVELDLGKDKRYRRVITRSEFENLITPWIDRTIQSCAEALSDGRVSADEIDQVIMVGGSTRIGLVQRRVGEFFEKEVYRALNPMEVVALGAGVQGSILAGQKRDVLLLDVVPLSLGIETMGGATSKMILRNSTIPCTAREMFTTFVDGQTTVKINVVQGERELAKDCRTLGELTLGDLPAMPAGIPQIEVNFLVDSNGILHVTARELRSERSVSAQLIPAHGLTREEVRQMYVEAMERAREDLTAHQLIDLRNQVDFDVRATEKSLAKVGAELPEQERREIERSMAEVRRISEGEDVHTIQRALKDFNSKTVRLAELAIKASLQENVEESEEQMAG